MKSTLAAAFFFLVANIAESRGYEFRAERAELLYTNSSFVKNVNFHFGKVNRTFLALNASFDIVRDFTDQKLLGSVKCYQFFHNEYRFTGTHITVDTCKLEKANIFSLKEQFREAQFNISLCKMRKGSYKLVNFTPNAKYFPQYLPLGKIKSNIRLHDGQGSDLFNLYWYFEIRASGNK